MCRAGTPFRSLFTPSPPRQRKQWLASGLDRRGPRSAFRPAEGDDRDAFDQRMPPIIRLQAPASRGFPTLVPEGEPPRPWWGARCFTTPGSLWWVVPEKKGHFPPFLLGTDRTSGAPVAPCRSKATRFGDSPRGREPRSFSPSRPVKVGGASDPERLPSVGYPREGLWVIPWLRRQDPTLDAFRPSLKKS